MNDQDKLEIERKLEQERDLLGREHQLKQSVESARRALQDAEGELREHGRKMQAFYAAQN